MKYERKLDWLAVTLPADTQPEDTLYSDGWVLVGKGVHGYQYRTEHTTGIVCQYGASDLRMGTHLSLSGDTLDNVRRDSVWSDDQMMDVLVGKLSGRVSRVDMAITMTATSESPKTLNDAIDNGTATVKTKTRAMISGKSGKVTGNTLYLGSRKSDRFLRFYDKNAEQKIKSDIARMRLELEVKGIMAHMAGKAMLQHGVDKVIIGHFDDFLKWDSADYNQALEGEIVALEKTSRKETSTEKWLLDQVAPSLAKVCELNPEFMDKFIRAFNNASEHKS